MNNVDKRVGLTSLLMVLMLNSFASFEYLPSGKKKNPGKIIYKKSSIISRGYKCETPILLLNLLIRFTSLIKNDITYLYFCLLQVHQGEFLTHM